MRAVVRSAVAVCAFGLGCAGSRAERVQERAAGHATPEPDPACKTVVAQSMLLTGLERVSVRVAIAGHGTAVDLLAPEMTPAQAQEIRRAFAECAWKPGPEGATTGTVTFSRP